MLTEQAKEDFRQFLEKSISHAVVTINGEEERKAIHRKERLSDGRVAVYITITPQSDVTTVIQRVQLYNASGKLWAEKEENISIPSVQEGVLYRFIFDFVEKEV
ncbi:MAG: hypothetical protein K2P21_06150 [Lachnospiraceae bacterium]|nr:hypothetical protein [Lachnospiraceae bacterium]